MEFFTGHDGVDWIAAILLFMSIWRLGEHKRDGFLWSIGAAAAWIVFNLRVDPPSAPGATINLIVLGISIRSWFRWNQTKDKNASTQPADPD